MNLTSWSKPTLTIERSLSAEPGRIVIPLAKYRHTRIVIPLAKYRNGIRIL
jgi:hypothetical protein